MVDNIVDCFAPPIRMPTYYKSDFTSTEDDIIAQETVETARVWGY